MIPDQQIAAIHQIAAWPQCRDGEEHRSGLNAGKYGALSTDKGCVDVLTTVHARRISWCARE
jgi:hypothetical protein